MRYEGAPGGLSSLLRSLPRGALGRAERLPPLCVESFGDHPKWHTMGVWREKHWLVPIRRQGV